MTTDLEDSYQKLGDLTFDHCKRTCKNLGSCCSTEYCLLAISRAEEFGVELKPADKNIPLLIDGKCIAPPYLRPLCTMHSCDISSVAEFKNEPQLTEQYFDLRSLIDELEYRRLDL